MHVTEVLFSGSGSMVPQLYDERADTVWMRSVHDVTQLPMFCYRMQGHNVSRGFDLSRATSWWQVQYRLTY
jgi:hypothetical protein